MYSDGMCPCTDYTPVCVVGVVSPVAVLTGHEQSVACVSLCSTLGLVVSVAAKCECVFQ